MPASHQKLPSRDDLQPTLERVLGSIGGFRSVAVGGDRSLQHTYVTETSDREADLTIEFDDGGDPDIAKKQRNAIEDAIQAAPEFEPIKLWKKNEPGHVYPVIHYSAD